MQKFIDPASIIAQAQLQTGQTVVDLGCGGGFYTIPAAKAVGHVGKIYAIDILESKLAVTQSSARQAGLKNIYVVKGDVDKPMIELEEASADLVIAASIIHQVYSKESLIKNMYRLLKTGGKALAVDWKKESTPLGPPLDTRISAADLEQIMTQAGFKKEKEMEADGFHYAILFTK